MKENYTLFINSQNTTNRIGTNKYNYQYYVNWNAIIPSELKNHKFLVKFTFMSYVQTSNIANVFTLNINFGGANSYDILPSKSNYLGFVFPYTNYSASASGTNSVSSYSHAKYSDNAPITIDYPDNNIITVNLVNINSGTGTNFSFDYILTLEFTPI